MSALISIVTPCYNEEGNVEELASRIAAVMQAQPYEYEHIFIDNCSTDGTIEKLRKLAAEDGHIKVILNARNFGWIRSPHYGLLQANGDAAILMASDLQDPPELIPEFIAKWEEGYKTVLAVKPSSEESRLMFGVRRAYYRLITRISEVPLIQNAHGTGLYDREVIDILKEIDDPYPYLRGLVAEIGLPIATVPFKQARRAAGVTKSSFYKNYDAAMLGITNHSKTPLRFLTAVGFCVALLSLFIAVGFTIAKLIFWSQFQLGVAPLIIGIFFIGSVQLLSLGIIGEYVGSIHTKVRRLPLVVEAERINFDSDTDD
jgi:glycosyltransferase involved in cell wall biosynthesis